MSGNVQPERSGLRYAARVVRGEPVRYAAPEDRDLIDDLSVPDDDTVSRPDEDEDALGELDRFIEPAAEEEQPGLDDEVASDLDIGVELGAGEETSSEGAEDLVLDIGELLDDARAREHQEAADEESGPPELEPSFGVTTFEDEPVGLDDAGDGSDGSDDELLDELPSIDADAPTDFDYALDPSLTELDDFGADEPIAHATPWARCDFGPDLGACYALGVADERLWIGGSGVWLAQGDAAPRLVLQEHGSLRALALQDDVVLYTSASGSLQRCTPDGQRLDVPTFSGAGTRVLRLSSAGRADHPLLLVQLSQGALLESDDAGSRFRETRLTSKVVALPTHADRTLVLASSSQGPELCRRKSDGHWAATALPPQARALASAEGVLLEVNEGVIAIADPERGLVVSADDGASFRVVPGCVGVTALCAARASGRAWLWCALYRQARDVSEIVLVDPESLKSCIIGTLANESGDVEDTDSSRLEALAWHAATRTLRAAGPRGVIGLRAPNDFDTV